MHQVRSARETSRCCEFSNREIDQRPDEERPAFYVGLRALGAIRKNCTSVASNCPSRLSRRRFRSQFCRVDRGKSICTARRPCETPMSSMAWARTSAEAISTRFHKKGFATRSLAPLVAAKTSAMLSLVS